MGTSTDRARRQMKPIRFSSFGGYRRWSRPWWRDVWRTCTYGWSNDVRAYWRRARYGWAPCDVWSFDDHLALILSGALREIADTCGGAPGGYPHSAAADVVWTDNGPVTDFARWESDLRRWAQACEDYGGDDLYQKFGDDYEARHVEERRRVDAMTAALIEMAPWVPALWT